MLIATLLAITLAAQNGEPLTCATVDPLLNTAVVVFPNGKARVSTYKDRGDRLEWNRPTHRLAKDAALEQGRTIRVDCRFASPQVITDPPEIVIYQ